MSREVSGGRANERRGAAEPGRPSCGGCMGRAAVAARGGPEAAAAAAVVVAAAAGRGVPVRPRPPGGRG